MDNPLVDKEYQLSKFPGKGGWTYVEIPEILQNKNNPFGWVTVRGCIDDFELKHYKLMPMGNGKLFLPVKAEIRKAIRKQAGDTVRIVLFADNLPIEIPNELLDCFSTEPPELLKRFYKLSQSEQKSFLDWIYSAKKEETKAQRIVSMMEQLSDRITKD